MTDLHFNVSGATMFTIEDHIQVISILPVLASLRIQTQSTGLIRGALCFLCTRGVVLNIDGTFMDKIN